PVQHLLDAPGDGLRHDDGAGEDQEELIARITRPEEHLALAHAPLAQARPEGEQHLLVNVLEDGNLAEEGDVRATGHSAGSCRGLMSGHRVSQVAQRFISTTWSARARSRSVVPPVLPTACMMAARSSDDRSNSASMSAGSRTRSARKSRSIIARPTRSRMPGCAIGSSRSRAPSPGGREPIRLFFAY